MVQIEIYLNYGHQGLSLATLEETFFYVSFKGKKSLTKPLHNKKHLSM
jgi:hypothetical protein